MSSNVTGITCCASVRSIPAADVWANRTSGASGVAQKSFIHQKGQQWYGRALVWQEETIETSVSACWEEEYQEAWLIISDLPAGKKRLSTYALRMRVESTFQDTCDPWLEHRSRPTQSVPASGTLALSPVSGRLVGGAFGRVLHSSRPARPL